MSRYQHVDVELTQDQIPALLAEWQERLRIIDWDIKVEIKPLRLLSRSDILGECDTGGKLDAHITLRAFKDADSRDLWPYDMEAVLVHELLEIKFDAFKEKGDDADMRKHAAQEVAIDTIAQALVQLKRDGGK